MNIRRGSALTESILAVTVEPKFNIDFLGNDFLLLVEGKDDVATIKDYYLHNNNNLGIRCITATDDIEGFLDVDSVNGKKMALKRYTEIKSQGRNIICLLDRDYDFYLNEDQSKKGIIYYNFFELENHLFDDAVAKIFVKNIYNYSCLDEYNEFIGYLSDLSNSCKSYAKLCYFREINYKESVLNEKQLDVLLNIIKIIPGRMMQMNHIDCEDKVNRIDSYIESQLNEQGLNISQIDYLIFHLGYEIDLLQSSRKNENLDIFKYAIKGKVLINSIQHFINYLYEKYPKLAIRKSEGNLSSLSVRLKLEWIPLYSNNFKNTLLSIENQFIEQSI